MGFEFTLDVILYNLGLKTLHCTPTTHVRTGPLLVARSASARVWDLLCLWSPRFSFSLLDGSSAEFHNILNCNSVQYGLQRIFVYWKLRATCKQTEGLHIDEGIPRPWLWTKMPRNVHSRGAAQYPSRKEGRCQNTERVFKAGHAIPQKGESVGDETMYISR
jgi:hypothetical protein